MYLTVRKATGVSVSGTCRKCGELVWPKSVKTMCGILTIFWDDHNDANGEPCDSQDIFITVHVGNE